MFRNPSNIWHGIFRENSRQVFTISGESSTIDVWQGSTHTSVKIIRLLQKQPAEMFHNKAFLKNCATFTGKPLCWSLSLIKLKPFRLCIPVNIPKFSRTPILKKKFERLLLVLVQCQLSFGTRSNAFWLHLEGFC